MGCRLSAFCLFIATVAVTALDAHQGDPKAGAPRTPYVGPGYLRGAAPLNPGAVAPFGPGAFPANDVILLSWIPLGQFGPGINSANDCWGYVSPSGREYAILGNNDGTAFAEITDPTHTTVIAQIDGTNSFWRDIKVYQEYAYSVSEGADGVQVIDLTRIDDGIVTNLGSVMTGGTPETHNVAIDETSGFLYRCGGGNNGLRIYSLADPANPQYVGEWPDRYVHDAQIITYTEGPYAGRQIAFCCSGFNGGWVQTGLDIVDVTDKTQPFLVKRMFYPSGAYSHQAWLSEDLTTLYLNDESDETAFGLPTTTRVIDVSDIDNPVAVSAFTNGVAAIGHNIYVRGDVIFEANYRSGLRVFDAADPLHPVETGFFDTFPDNDETGFQGLWSVFPFFPSGTVIGSDVERGLFVWHTGPLPLAFGFPEGPPSVVLAEGGDTVRVEITDQTESFAPGTARFYYDVGNGFEELTLVSVGGSIHEATFPELPCGVRMSYYVAAETVSGRVVTDPPFAAPPSYTTMVASEEELAFADDMEVDTGWTVGAVGDAATGGIWENVDPNGTAAQPEDDHSPNGTFCWVTGQGAVGGPIDADDVDGGRTSLTSPLMDATRLTEPRISYWRWVSNSEGRAPQSDFFLVTISNNGGTHWTLAETVGPTGAEVRGGWIFHQFFVDDFVTPTDEMQVRFMAFDGGAPSTVEAAIDDFRLTGVICTDCAIPFIRGDADGTGNIGLGDALYVLAWIFSNGPEPIPNDAGDVNADGKYALADGLHLLEYLFIDGPPPAPPFPEPGCP